MSPDAPSATLLRPEANELMRGPTLTGAAALVPAASVVPSVQPTR